MASKRSPRAAKKKVGRPRKRDNTHAFVLRLPNLLHAEIRLHAAVKHESMNDALVALVTQAWSREPKRRTYSRLAVN